MSRLLVLTGWLCGRRLSLALGASVLASAPPAPLLATVPPPPDHARVIVTQDASALEVFTPRSDVVRRLVDAGLRRLTEQPTAAAAWRALVSTQDTVGIKVLAAPGPLVGTRPAVVEALVQGLLEAGLPPRQIVIWDKRLSDLRLAGYGELARRYGVRLAGSADAGYDEHVSYTAALVGKLLWGDLEFGKSGEGVGRRSFVSKLLTQEVTKLVLVSPLLNHNQLGVSGNLYSLAFGSVDNTLRFETSPVHLAQAIPELCAMEVLGDRVVLCVMDALLGQYVGEELARLHQSAKLNQLWFSRDPVALDVLAIQRLEDLRTAAGLPPTKPKLDVYDNAALLELGVSDPKKIHLIPE